MDLNESEETYDIQVTFNEIHKDWIELCQKLHEEGLKEYGVFTFLEDDVIDQMANELAKLSNLCMVQYMKIMLLQRTLEQRLTEEIEVEDGNITMGINAFKSSGKDAN